MHEDHVLPLIISATATEREDWDDHDLLLHLGDGFRSLWYKVEELEDRLAKPQPKAARASTVGTILGIALTILVVAITYIGGSHNG